jgi:manganese transport protein
VELLETLQINDYHKIAIALDFSADDHKLLSHAIKQGNAQSSFLLIHIVESASARLLGTDSDDLETRADQERLQVYLNFLHQKGFKATGRLGFNNRTKEIVKIIQEENADMLIIGGHGHTGIKDWIYGETVNDVRHSLKIPVLIISL